VIDEVLAVGDNEFQQRCLGRMDDLSGQGRTILLVSHNLAVISAICPNAILLDQGKCVMAGDVYKVLDAYSANDDLTQTITDRNRWNPSSLLGGLSIREAHLRTKNRGILEFGEPISVELLVHRIETEPLDRITVLLAVSSFDGTAIMTGIARPFDVQWKTGHSATLSLSMENPGLVAGHYHFEISIGHGDEFGIYNHHEVLVKVLPFAAQPPPTDSGGTASYWPPSWGNIRLNPFDVHIDS
jgi:lipopolysaccharide transport system ATP-binding protein